MDTGLLLGVLALGTMIAALIFALRSKKRVEDKLNDPAEHRPENKSTLAKDSPDH